MEKKETATNTDAFEITQIDTLSFENYHRNHQRYCLYYICLRFGTGIPSERICCFFQFFNTYIPLLDVLV